MARDNCCDFDMKFKEGETKFDLSFGINDGSGVLPAEIEVLGQLENVQLVGEAPDLTGLSFNVIYQKKQIDPGVSPSQYSTTGQQNITLSYTENGVTIFRQIPVDVQRIPVSLAITGDWSNPQYWGEAPDLTGLVFTANFSDGESFTIPHNEIIFSPSKWAFYEGTQVATFSYTYEGVTQTATKNAPVKTVPSAYRKVTYIESSGTQYINTGHAFSDDFAFEISFEGFEPNSSTLFGGRTNAIRTLVLYRLSGSANFSVNIASYSGVTTPFQFEGLDVGRHLFKMAVKANKGSVWVDDVQAYNNRSFNGSYITGVSQTLFADNYGDRVVENCSSKVYSLKMWQGSTLVRFLVPCYRISDSEAGMYDLVTDTFLTNSGTGTFVVGGDV